MVQVGEFEQRMLSEIKAKQPAIVEAIRTDKALKPDTEQKLRSFLDGFAKAFVA